MALLIVERCNIYGAETGGAQRLLGGLSSSKVKTQWYCKNRSIARYFMQCAHGHRGQLMPLCESHRRQYGSSVTFCPKCNAEPPGHKCPLTLIEKS